MIKRTVHLIQGTERELLSGPIRICEEAEVGLYISEDDAERFLERLQDMFDRDAPAIMQGQDYVALNELIELLLSVTHWEP